MVRVQEEWQLPHPPERVLARLTGGSPLGQGVPGFDPPPTSGAPGRLRIRLGAAQVTVTGRATIRMLPDGAGERRLQWEAEGRRARGPGTGRVRVTLGLLPQGSGTRVRLEVDAELHDWSDPPGDDAVAAALRRLLRTAQRGTAHALDADAPGAAPAVDARSPVRAVAPIEVVPPAAPTLVDELGIQGVRLWRAARDHWPVGLLLVGAGAALAVWRGASGRRGPR